MSDFDHTTPPAQVQGWPDPTTEQVSLIARVLAPHIHRLRAERRAAEQSTRRSTAVRAAA
ncbi:hypothetical protein [Kitasatospora sp. A2-31]|uniref:hypothetical protein n=1 Tax=Kitasatospora sp. A2-31 TaxID=2916414 RepID=UPI001EEDEC31|nr:hypothetical protein [Kitasatospora sp. A2-31]MCG6499214.1 hypothetical protein [Kitasatospora sp. A2-31]